MKTLYTIILSLILLNTNCWAYDYTKDTRCVAAYLMSEGSGTTIADVSTNGFGGTGNFLSSGHPSWDNLPPAFLKIGTAQNDVSFSPNTPFSDVITAGINNNVMNSGSPLTIVAWIYPTIDSVNGHDPRIVCRSTASTGTTEVCASIETTKQLYLDPSSNDSSGTGPFRSSVNNTITFNTWQFVMWTWDGSTTGANIHIYTASMSAPVLTEVSYSSTSNGTGAISNAGDTLYIGNTALDGESNGGKIAQVAIFNSVLSLNDGQQMANYGITGQGLVFINKAYINNIDLN